MRASRYRRPMGYAKPIGDLLRHWRQKRHLSQLDLALEAEISTRHLSFVETGRAQPSRDMILRLAERLEVPLRERNALLIAAGFAPKYQERGLDDPALGAARQAVDTILRAHEPWPALALDRHWNMVMANAAVAPLLTGIDAALLTPPVNVLRLSLHPGGLAPRIVNLGEWRSHLLARLQRQIEVSGDAVLADLREELRALPAPLGPAPHGDGGAVAMPLRLKVPGGELSFISTTTVFGTPVDITLSELALETLFPADEATAAALRAA